MLNTNLNFIEKEIIQDINNGLPINKLKFRFPPEPNGFLHIGHVKAITLNFNLAKKFNSKINLRFDDTNPNNEYEKFINQIKEDINWLGYKWSEETYTSDYFDILYKWALILINKNKAYVDIQDSNTILYQKGTIQSHGIDSPFRNSTIEKNLELFDKMKNGKFREGECVLRAKVDMKSPNMNMRDPIMYRILYKYHPRTSNKWCIYPTYDWSHGLCDYIEQISHSLCSIEFRHHREIYDWFINEIYDKSNIKPKQYEFARGNINNMITSKREIIKLIKNKCINGWDDPRIATIAGLKNKGYTPTSIINFWEKVGITKRENNLDSSLLNYFLRNELNKKSVRYFVVQNPLKIIIENYPNDKSEIIYINENPEDKDSDKRKLIFSKEIYINKDDFMEVPNEKYFKLSINKEVRLIGAYIIKCNRLKKDNNGNITELYVTYDKESKSGSNSYSSKRKVQSNIHWVPSLEYIDNIYVTSYDNNKINTIKCIGETNISNITEEERVQFQRTGYFILKEKSNNGFFFNKIIDLKR